ncbi:MAG: DUF2905 domain-containing protein [Candidatus Mcinerneyibacterium aminivorans]|jgi:hypothetical protein|uniref:DUF2905 domain-containing protein n=1 Tax=Candidatus Mcinerneyibacterium aminivorans TaxID=2703815 RepID=A0A5D0MHJ9_9BACT|nr:MAG: DUF2905 domain-containing protein [Candidatus Mcinerneyibacterium aminivorans]
MQLNKEVAKLIILAGIVLVFLGVLIYFTNGKIKLFNLPGDIYIEKKNFTFYFPITSMVIISIIISIIIRLFKSL